MLAFHSPVSKHQPTDVIPVGASLLAKIVNDDAASLTNRVALAFIASKLAPTGVGCCRQNVGFTLVPK
ncbi:hypothetical protein C1890_04895 [Pseudomonas sp. DP16D-R1]|nr:hypothetical protein C1890_04895 [Pseudomonas sp. DP16D-R1]